MDTNLANVSFKIHSINNDTNLATISSHWLQLSGTNGQYKIFGTPSENNIGTYDIVLRADDGDVGGVTNETIQINVIEDPVITNLFANTSNTDNSISSNTASLFRTKLLEKTNLKEKHRYRRTIVRKLLDKITNVQNKVLVFNTTDIGLSSTKGNTKVKCIKKNVINLSTDASTNEMIYVPLEKNEEVEYTNIPLINKIKFKCIEEDNYQITGLNDQTDIPFILANMISQGKIFLRTLILE